MNTQLVKALVEMVKSLPPDERAVFDLSLLDIADVVYDSRCDRLKQQDEYLRELLPNYKPVNCG